MWWRSKQHNENTDIGKIIPEIIFLEVLKLTKDCKTGNNTVLCWKLGKKTIFKNCLESEVTKTTYLFLNYTKFIILYTCRDKSLFAHQSIDLFTKQYLTCSHLRTSVSEGILIIIWIFIFCIMIYIYRAHSSLFPLTTEMLLQLMTHYKRYNWRSTVISAGSSKIKILFWVSLRV